MQSLPLPPPSSSPHELPPLTSAAVVCHSNGDVEALLHVVERISEFLDFATPDFFSIERACEHGNLQLLQRVAARDTRVIDRYYKAYLASKGLVAAVKNDDLEIVQWLCTEYCPSLIPTKGIQVAVKLSKLRVLDWLYSHYKWNPFWSIEIAALAVRHGRLDVLQWIVPQSDNAEYETRWLRTAASSGHFGMARWLHERTQLYAPGALSPASRDTLMCTVRAGHFDIGQFLFNQGYALDSSRQDHPRTRSYNEDREFVRWLNTLPRDEGTLGWIDVAAGGGYLHLVQLSVDNVKQDDCTTRAMDDAARNGHLHVVKWLHENRSEGCTTNAMNGAAGNGHLEVVQWLHANRSEGCTFAAMSRAAASGHLNVVKWLHEHRSEGCSKGAMNTAAWHGYLEIVKWLHHNRREGCSPAAMDLAATNGHLDVVQWLHKNRSEGCTTDAMDGAAKYGHLDVVKWLHKTRSGGCTAKAMDGAAINGHLDVVKWLHENRSEGCTTDAMDGACSLEMVQWLHENRAERCTLEAMENACEGFFDVLLFFHDHYDHGYTDGMARHAIETHNFEIFQWLQAHYPEQADLEDVVYGYPRTYNEFVSVTMAPTTVKRRRLSHSR